MAERGASEQYILEESSSEPLRCVLVIPAHNEEDGIAACLDAIAAAPLPRGVVWEECVLADDGSDDRTVERFLTWGKSHSQFRTRVQSKGVRLGKAVELEEVRRLLANRHDSGVIMVVCDADSTVEKSALEYLLRPFVEYGELAVTWGISVPKGDRSQRRASWFQAQLMAALGSYLGELEVRAHGRLFALRVNALKDFDWRPGYIVEDTQLASFVKGHHLESRTAINAKIFITPARGWRDFYYQTYRSYHADARIDACSNSSAPLSVHRAETIEEGRMWRAKLWVFGVQTLIDPVGAAAYVGARCACVVYERLAPAEFVDTWPESRSTKNAGSTGCSREEVGNGHKGSGVSWNMISKQFGEKVTLTLRSFVVCCNRPNIVASWWSRRERVLQRFAPLESVITQSLRVAYARVTRILGLADDR